MTEVTQKVYIKWGLGVPKLKGRLRPIILAPIRQLIKPPVKEKLPVYIDPEPLRPVVPETMEPPLAEPIQPVIPEYIGDLDGQPSQIHKDTSDGTTTHKSGETSEDDNDAPLTL